LLIDFHDYFHISPRRYASRAAASVLRMPRRCRAADMPPARAAAHSAPFLAMMLMLPAYASHA